MEVLERILIGWATAMTLIASVWAVWCFLFTEVAFHAPWRTRVIWAFGGVVLAACVGTVALMAILGLSRLVMAN